MMVLIRFMSVALAVVSSVSARPAAEFEQYRVEISRTVRHAHLKFDDAKSRRYRTELRDAASGDADYADHYIVAEIGCGAGCVEVAVIDQITGKVIWLSETVSNWPRGLTEPLAYQRDSSLMIVHGQLNERGSIGPHRFLLSNGVLKPLSR